MAPAYRQFNPAAFSPRQTAASQLLGISQNGAQGQSQGIFDGSQTSAGLPFGLSQANASQYGYTYSPAQQRWIPSDGSEAYGYGNQANQTTAYGLGGTTGMSAAGAQSTYGPPPSSNPPSAGSGAAGSAAGAQGGYSGGTSGFMPNVKQILDYYKSMAGGQWQGSAQKQPWSYQPEVPDLKPGQIWAGSDHPESNVWKQMPDNSALWGDNEPAIPSETHIGDQNDYPMSGAPASNDAVYEDIQRRQRQRLSEDDLSYGGKTFTPGVDPTPIPKAQDQGGAPETIGSGWDQWPSGGPQPTQWPEEQQSSDQAQVIGPGSAKLASTAGGNSQPLDSSWLSYVLPGGAGF